MDLNIWGDIHICVSVPLMLLVHESTFVEFVDVESTALINVLMLNIISDFKGFQ